HRWPRIRRRAGTRSARTLAVQRDRAQCVGSQLRRRCRCFAAVRAQARDLRLPLAARPPRATRVPLVFSARCPCWGSACPPHPRRCDRWSECHKVAWCTPGALQRLAFAGRFLAAFFTSFAALFTREAASISRSGTPLALVADDLRTLSPPRTLALAAPLEAR